MANRLYHLKRQVSASTLLVSHVKWSFLPLLFGVVCYINSLEGDLVHDDIFAIKENFDLLPSTPISRLFMNDFWGESMSSETSHKSYRPLTVLTFRFNYLLHGLDPWGYHLGNLFLHLVCTLLFGWLCTSEVFGAAQPQLGMLAMLLFAVHPVHTEAVS